MQWWRKSWNCTAGDEIRKLEGIWKSDGSIHRGYGIMNEKERMLSGKLYNPYKVGDSTWEKSREVLEQFNSMLPFYCDKGTRIYIGKHFYANTVLLVLDAADVRIGDHVFIGPRVCIYTASHPIDADIRRMELERAAGVTIGSNVVKRTGLSRRRSILRMRI